MLLAIIFEVPSASDEDTFLPTILLVRVQMLISCFHSG